MVTEMKTFGAHNDRVKNSQGQSQQAAVLKVFLLPQDAQNPNPRLASVDTLGRFRVWTQ